MNLQNLSTAAQLAAQYNQAGNRGRRYSNRGGGNSGYYHNNYNSGNYNRGSYNFGHGGSRGRGNYNNFDRDFRSDSRNPPYQQRNTGTQATE